MSPIKIKTYSRKCKTDNKLVNTLKKKLIHKNVARRGRYKSKIKELPPKQDGLQLTNGSFDIEIDDTFDKMRKTTKNHVKIDNNFQKFESSEIDHPSSTRSLSKIDINTSDKSRSKIRNCSIPIVKLENVSKEQTNIDTFDQSINSSLSIEIVPRKKYATTLSYIDVSGIKANYMNKSSSIKDLEVSDDLFGVGSFRDKHINAIVHSSTPLIPKLREKLATSIISPIYTCHSTNSSKVSTHIGNEEKLATTDNSSEKQLFVSLDKGRIDWKLHVQPKVYLRKLSLSKFKGFTSKEQISTKSNLSIFKTSISKHFVDCSDSQNNTEKSDELLENSINLSKNVNKKLTMDVIEISEDGPLLSNSSKSVFSNSFTDSDSTKDRSLYIIDESLEDLGKHESKKKPLLVLKPGKLYRRTLVLNRRSVWSNIVLNERTSIFGNSIITSNDRRSLENFVRGYVSGDDYRKQSFNVVLEESIVDVSLNKSSFILNPDELPAKDLVLEKCNQIAPLSFQECYPESVLKNCQKIGEGVYGEVFLYKNLKGDTSVMKIIPIEGDLLVNGEKQKSFQEILSELIISLELDKLRDGVRNRVSSYSQVKNFKCVYGHYPARLIELWDLFNEVHGSENDSPEIFEEDQMYIVLELNNGGKDLESYLFNNAAQAYSMFKQVACALAVAESELQFEHRDLHWGNILINTVERNKTINVILNGDEIAIQSYGIEVTIIDFTLSRIGFNDVVMFNDLSKEEELFSATGDYQFEIYQLMRKRNCNKWHNYEPYSNILWLHYVIHKALVALRYKNTKSKIHRDYMKKLQQLESGLLTFNSTTQFVNSTFL